MALDSERVESLLLLPMYTFKTKPFPHQETEFNHSRNRVRRCLFWEMGCVDGETEYLSPEGWKKIKNYNGGRVAQWFPETGLAEWAKPEKYIVKPCDAMYKISGRSGTNQVLSSEHRIPVLTKRGNRYKETISTKQLVERLDHNSLIRLPSKFILDLKGPGLGLSEKELRLQVAVMADGTFPSNALHTKRCTISLKKHRKIQRLRYLLRGVKEVNERRIKNNEYTFFSFYAPLRIKKWPVAWLSILSNWDRDIILDEIFKWDGTELHGRKIYFSKHEFDIDFIQFLAASAGYITNKQHYKRKIKHKEIWQISIRSVRINGFVITKKNISVVIPTDRKKYCFSMPSGYWIARREGKPFPTGNTGKSKVAIDTAADLYDNGEIDGVFILAPNGVHDNWTLDELPVHLPDEIADQTEIFTWNTNKRHSKRYQRDFKAFMNRKGGLSILAMSFDSLMTQDSAYKFKAFIKERRCLGIADESTVFKTPDAKVTKRVVSSARYAPYRRILTGTPVADSPLQAYSQLKFVDPKIWQRTLGLQDFQDFKTYFAKWIKLTRRKDGLTFPKFVGWKNLDQLSEILGQLGSRILKKDVLKFLPPKLYNKIYFSLSARQQKMYNDLEREYRAWFGDGSKVSAALAIVRQTRLQQICSGYLPADSEHDLRAIDEKENPRLQALAEAVEMIPKQAIIWAKYNIDVDMIAHMLQKMGKSFVTYDGRTPKHKRHDIKKGFQEGRYRFFVSKPSAAGRGFTLTAADTVVYYNNSFSLDDRDQSEDRAHRIGSEIHDSVNYIDIVGRSTVDEHILSILRNKKNISSAVMGDELPLWI